MKKIISKKRPSNPEENLKRLIKLNSDMEILRPYCKPKGLILRFKTYDELLMFSINRGAKKQ